MPRRAILFEKIAVLDLLSGSPGTGRARLANPGWCRRLAECYSVGRRTRLTNRQCTECMDCKAARLILP